MDQQFLRDNFTKRISWKTFGWAPGATPQQQRHRVAGNEETETCIKHAAAITNAATMPTSFISANAKVRRTLIVPLPCHCRIKRSQLHISNGQLTATRGNAVFFSSDFELVMSHSFKTYATHLSSLIRLHDWLQRSPTTEVIWRPFSTLPCDRYTFGIEWQGVLTIGV